MAGYRAFIMSLTCARRVQRVAGTLRQHAGKVSTRAKSLQRFGVQSTWIKGITCVSAPSKRNSKQIPPHRGSFQQKPGLHGRALHALSSFVGSLKGNEDLGSLAATSWGTALSSCGYMLVLVLVVPLEPRALLERAKSSFQPAKSGLILASQVITVDDLK